MVHDHLHSDLADFGDCAENRMEVGMVGGPDYFNF